MLLVTTCKRFFEEARDMKSDWRRYKNGKLLHEDVSDCAEFWTEDSVAFLSE